MSLTKTEINFYKTKGYLVKKKLISENEIKKINNLIRKILKKEEGRNTKIKNLGGSFNNNFVYNSNSSNKREILRLNNPTYYNKLFYNLSRNKKIINIVKKLLGGSVRFHHCKLNFKLPSKKGGEVSWHQDWAFYPHTNDDLITVGVYLEDCDEENGPLHVKKGEVVGLIGDNGAGKSTLIKTLVGVYSPDEGEILIRGNKINSWNALKAREAGIETVFQDRAIDSLS